MPQLTVDAATLARIRAISETAEVRNEAGELVGYFSPIGTQEDGKSWQSPNTREELERRRQVRTGRPLADILTGLGAK